MTKRTVALAKGKLLAEGRADIASDASLTDLSDLEDSGQLQNPPSESESNSDNSDISRSGSDVERRRKQPGVSDSEDDSDSESAQEEHNSDDDDYSSGADRRAAAGKKPIKKKKGKVEDDSEDAKPRRKRKIAWTGSDSPFDLLGDELLSSVFAHLTPGSKSTLHFSQTCKRFNATSKEPYARCQYLVNNFGADAALYNLVRLGSVCDTPTLDSLLGGDRVPYSRYFFQIAMNAYARRVPHWLPKKWARDTLPLKNYVALVSKAEELFGNFNTNFRTNDGVLFEAWVTSKGNLFAKPKRRRFRWHQHGQLSDVVIVSEEEQLKIRNQVQHLVTEDRFCFFSAEDPTIPVIMKRLETDKDYIDNLIQLGFRLTSGFCDKFFKALLLNKLGSKEKMLLFDSVYSKKYATFPDQDCVADVFRTTTTRSWRPYKYLLECTDGQIDFMVLLCTKYPILDICFRSAILSIVDYLSDYSRTADIASFAGHLVYLLQAFLPPVDTETVKFQQLVFQSVLFLLRDSASVRQYHAHARHDQYYGRMSWNHLRALTASRSEHFNQQTALDVLKSWKLTAIAPQAFQVVLGSDLVLADHAVNLFKAIDIDDELYVTGFISLVWAIITDVKKLEDYVNKLDGLRSQFSAALTQEFALDSSNLIRKQGVMVTGFRSPLSYRLPVLTTRYSGVSNVQIPSHRQVYKVENYVKKNKVLLGCFGDDQAFRRTLLLHACLNRDKQLINDASETLSLDVEIFEMLSQAGVPMTKKGMSAIYQSPFTNEPSGKKRGTETIPVSDMHLWMVALEELIKKYPDETDGSALDGRLTDTSAEKTFVEFATEWIALIKDCIRVKREVSI